MKSHKGKFLAPILVTIIFAIYFLLYFGILFNLLNGFWKYAFGIIPLAFLGVLIYVCVERIKEIKKGEEDDLSKY